jgi:uncharacterized membrane protein YagU involved in acid resistance
MSARAWGWCLLGGAVVGSLDLLFAWGFWVGRGASLGSILQSIAAGWYGAASRTMGATSIAVGAVSHYVIATAFVVAYALALRRWPLLARRPLAYGALYGLILYAVMHLVVLPLSSAGAPSFNDAAWVASSIAMHLVFGALCAWFAQAAFASD